MLTDTYTSTGAKLFHHQEVMEKLRNGEGQPITTHVMLTDVCNHTCAFCSVQARAGDTLPFEVIMKYLDILQGYGLKSVILSGGGNPILYKCKHTRTTFVDVVNGIHARGLEIGCITNGMSVLRLFEAPDHKVHQGSPQWRESWPTVPPDTLDKLTWLRISLAGLDHSENDVYVPDVDQSKTTLGFSYVAHDIYDAPEDHHHGKVSTVADVEALGGTVTNRKVRRFEDRIDELIEQFIRYATVYHPAYIRLLPNCLEPWKIEARCEQLRKMAAVVNTAAGREVAFVQYKPPKAPDACLLGYVHPVLNCDGYVYPCDSCVLNEAAGHQFGHSWRICHASEVARLYDEPVRRSLIEDTHAQCPGCVFPRTNEILGIVRDGAKPAKPTGTIEHVNFV